MTKDLLKLVRALCYKDQEAKSMFHGNGLTKALVNLLPVDGGFNGPTLLEAIHALTSLISGCTQRCRDAFRAGALDHIKIVLDSECEEELKVAATACLANLSYSREACEEARSHLDSLIVRGHDVMHLC